jgi:hypothetical protein
MKRTRNVLLLLCAAAAWSTGAFAQHPSAPPVDKVAVLAQNLTKLESTGKVKAALWTLRNDSCTLQLVLPWGMAPLDRNAPLKPVELFGPGLAAPLPEVKVWLLTANGAQISATKVSRPDPEKFGLRTIAAEFSYSFPRWVNGQAVAAAIQIGDDYYIEKLQKLADQPL